MINIIREDDAKKQLPENKHEQDLETEAFFKEDKGGTNTNI